MKWLIILCLVLQVVPQVEAREGGSDTGGYVLGGTQLQITPQMQEFGVDRIASFEQTFAWREAELKVNLVESVAPEFGELLKASLGDIEFYGTVEPVALTQPNTYSAISSIMYVQNSKTHVIFSVPMFNELELDAQTEFILHEAIRSMRLRNVININAERAKVLLKSIASGDISDERLMVTLNAISKRLKAK